MLTRLTYTIFCLTIICAGCASKPSASQPAEPVAGLKPARSRAEYTSEQLSQLYIANVTFGDWYLARLAAACDALAQDAGSPAVRYEALRLKAAQGVSVSSIVSSPNPVVQLLSLQVVLELTRVKWIDEGKAVAVFGDRGKLLIDALNEMQTRQRSLALSVITENEFHAVREAALRWRAANPQISDVEFIRFEDFAAELARSLPQHERADFMSTLNNAAAGISEIWLLGARALHMMSRYPRIMQWQLEAQTADVAKRPEMQTLLDDLTRMAHAAEELKPQITHLQSTLDSFPQKLADSFTGGPVIKQAIARADLALARGETATRQLAAMEDSVRQLNSSVDKLTQQLVHVNQTYEPEEIKQMAEEVKITAAREVRSIIYLVGCLLVCLMVLHAVLRRWSHSGRNGARVSQAS